MIEVSGTKNSVPKSVQESAPHRSSWITFRTSQVPVYITQYSIYHVLAVAVAQQPCHTMPENYTSNILRKKKIIHHLT